MSEREHRRKKFIDGLHESAQDIERGNKREAAAARGELARLRRSLREMPRSGAMVLRPRSPVMTSTIHEHQPPLSEVDAWQLVAGLFAMNPTARPGDRIATALGRLPRNASIEARMRRLVSADDDSRPFYLRQAVQLLGPVPLDYRQLLDDVIELGLSEEPDRAYRVRLRWAREFFGAGSTRSAAIDDTNDDRTNDEGDDA